MRIFLFLLTLGLFGMVLWVYMGLYGFIGLCFDEYSSGSFWQLNVNPMALPSAVSYISDLISFSSKASAYIFTIRSKSLSVNGVLPSMNDMSANGASTGFSLKVVTYIGAFSIILTYTGTFYNSGSYSRTLLNKDSCAKSSSKIDLMLRPSSCT